MSSELCGVVTEDVHVPRSPTHVPRISRSDMVNAS